jgi:hypothetical protein
LEENDFKDYIKKLIPDPHDAQELVDHKKKEVKAKQVLLDFVKDHLIPHIFEKKTSKKMYDALVGLYQSGNTNQKLILRHKLRSVEMFKSGIVASYLIVKFGSIDSHSPMRGHMGHPEASQGDLENQPVL